MRRNLAVVMLALAVVAPLLWTEDASARAGRGGSSGSRGSRSHSAPARPSPDASTAGRPAAPPSALAHAPAGGGWGALGGFLAGGLLGRFLFEGPGGGMGLSDIVILGLLAFFAWKLLRTRGPVPAPTYASIGPDGGHHALARSFVPTSSDLNTGVGQARQIDPSFDNAAFAQTATELFIKVQEAWAARDVRPIGMLLTPEMQTELQRDCELMKDQGRVNRLDNITMSAADVVEAWNEQGQDYVTVRLEACLLDYTTDDKTGQVVEGSASEPVTFEEFWTFTRRRWAKTWRLSAIQQPVQAAH